MMGCHFHGQLNEKSVTSVWFCLSCVHSISLSLSLSLCLCLSLSLCLWLSVSLLVSPCLSVSLFVSLSLSVSTLFVSPPHLSISVCHCLSFSPSFCLSDPLFRRRQIRYYELSSLWHPLMQRTGRGSRATDRKGLKPPIQTESYHCPDTRE